MATICQVPNTGTTVNFSRTIQHVNDLTISRETMATIEGAAPPIRPELVKVVRVHP